MENLLIIAWLAIGMNSKSLSGYVEVHYDYVIHENIILKILPYTHTLFM
jgi:hypothetical protein